MKQISVNECLIRGKFRYHTSPFDNYRHPLDFSEYGDRDYLIEDGIAWTQKVVRLPKGVPTFDELVKYREYKREYGYKPNDWDAIEPKAVCVNGFIIDHMELMNGIVDHLDDDDEDSKRWKLCVLSHVDLDMMGDGWFEFLNVITGYRYEPK